MTELSDYQADAYELPEEWQRWLDTDVPDADPAEPPDHLGPFSEPPAPSTPWHIENDHVATWALRKLAAAERETLRLVDLATAEMQRIKEWLERESKRPARDVEFFRGHLTAYWRRQMDALMAPYLERGMAPEEAWDEIKRKSLSLPTGKLTARRTPPGVEVVDEEQFVRWAQENGYEHLLRAKPALAEIKELPTEDGEVVVIVGHTELGGTPTAFPVPGVKVKPTEFRYDAKPDVD